MDTKNYAKMPKESKPSLSRTSPFYGLVLTSLALFSLPAYSFEPLNDDAMRDVNAQALFTLGYLAPSDNTNLATDTNGAKNIGFYRLGMEAEIELNANIKNLQLGCGGSNNSLPGKNNMCDIDIKNLSLSGSPTGHDSTGSPVFDDERAATSAKLTNPFVEFAIKNPQSAATREVVGFRLSAEAIEGLLTAGLENLSVPTTNDGIQSLSGFLQIAATTGKATTAATTFGKYNPAMFPGQQVNDHRLQGYAWVNVLGIVQSHVLFTSVPNHADTTGITVPSVDAYFPVEAFTINGVRQKDAILKDIRTTLERIPIAVPTTGDPAWIAKYPASMFANDQLYVTLGCNSFTGSGFLSGCSTITGIKSDAKFKMAAGSEITNLNLKIDFEQSLSMIHNIPLTGTGGYLSLQGIPLIWPGATVERDGSGHVITNSANTDVAQKGWWMSFAEPVQLGELNTTNDVVLDNDVLKQVATQVTNFLMNTPINSDTPGSNTPRVNANNLGSSPPDGLFYVLGNNPLSALVQANLNAGTSANPVYVPLSNQQLNNQGVASNCWGSLKFC